MRAILTGGKGIVRFTLVVALGLMVSACATTNIVAEKANRFDQGVALYDAGDFPGAYAVWNQLADENDLAAMRNTAHLLRAGKGVAQDKDRALSLYKEAARKGLVLAMANVADMTLAGEGTKRDPEEAAGWYAMAASSGLSLAMMKLGEMYETGLGVKKDAGRARALYERSARNGYAPAQAKLRAMGLPEVVVLTGAQGQNPNDPFRARSTPKSTEVSGAEQASPKAEQTPSASAASAATPIDAAVAKSVSPPDMSVLQAGLQAYQAGKPVDAFKLWRELAQKGVADAQFRLGWLYEHGQGIGQDVIEAYRWYRLGALKLDANAAKGAARIGAQLSPAELAIAESLVQKPNLPAKAPIKQN
jgi:TPR repeat protein